MLTISLNENGLHLNQQIFNFPIPLEKLLALLGTSPRILKYKANTVYVWDESGIAAYAPQDHLIETIEVSFQHEDFDSSPQQAFKGQFIYKQQDAISVFFDQPELRQMAYEGDSRSALITDQICASFHGDFKQKQIEGISFSAYQTPTEHEKLLLDSRFAHLEQLWTDWMTAIEQIVPQENEYYNLKHGIEQQDILNLQQQQEMQIPEILINFYKAHNVEWDAVTSVFSFSVDGMGYDLLPFEDIYQHWQNNVELNTGEHLDASNYPNYDARTKINDYTNVSWIPFAESRDGDYLMLDLDPAEGGTYGQIIELQNESWERNIIANSLEHLVEMTIKQLNNPDDDRYEFILENG